MRTFLAVGLICSAALASSEDAVKTKTPAEAIASLVSFVSPKGWSLLQSADAGGVDLSVRFEKGEDGISIKVFGAPGTAYRTPTEFLSGPAASTLGRRPEVTGETPVAGRSLALYRRGFPVATGDPHAPGSARPLMGTEVFCLLPLADGRFAVLSYARATPIPDMKGRGGRAWKRFLKTVKPVR